FVGETKKTAVSQRAVTNSTREVLTKHLKAGQETVVATEPKNRDGGSLDVIITEPDTPSQCTEGAATCQALPSGGEHIARSQLRAGLLLRKILWSRPTLLWRGFLRECRSFYHRMGNRDLLSAVRFGV